jgi:hypothetical protein
MSLPYRWNPDGVQRYGNTRPPTVGDLVPRDHAVWRVIEVSDRDEVDWSDGDRERIAAYKAEYRHKLRPQVYVMRRLDQHTRDNDLHLRYGGEVGTMYYKPYPDQHYPICAECHEPSPCRDKMAEQVSEQAAKRMARYDQAGVCPSCMEVITHKQQRLTWPDNAMIIGGPPVSFHRRNRCYRSAVEYETAWVAQDPDNRRAQLSCRGGVTNHNDGTYECSELIDCPGPHAQHRYYTVCDCRECHARGSFGCNPSSTSRNLALDSGTES